MKVVLIAGVLILLVLLITPGAAVSVGGTTTALAAREAISIDLAAVGHGPQGPPVLIPTMPTPRSPYAPPSWVPGPPPNRGPRNRR